jgi:hypothetical protein
MKFIIRAIIFFSVNILIFSTDLERKETSKGWCDPREKTFDESCEAYWTCKSSCSNGLECVEGNSNTEKVCKKSLGGKCIFHSECANDQFCHPIKKVCKSLSQATQFELGLADDLGQNNFPPTKHKSKKF